ncbi:MAG: Rieske 2Fe-2S domain-containing protein [Desulfarculus sp.]|nr:Rieske 2Fe-2S domain-containing protein [Desulfarculus sp.]
MEATRDTTPSRRGLFKGLALVIWAGLVAALGLGLGAALRLAGAGSGPRARPRLDLGPATEIKPGQVVSREDVALLRDAKGLYALSLVCPHLGCRPVWRGEEERFLCPCHGSAFAPDGRRLMGPAPRGLTGLWVEIDRHGHAWVDPKRGVDASRRLALG